MAYGKKRGGSLKKGYKYARGGRVVPVKGSGTKGRKSRRSRSTRRRGIV